LRLMKSAAMVPSPQSRLQRPFGGLLHAEIECGVDLQSALIQILDAVLRLSLDVLPDLLGKIRADARRFFAIRAEDERGVARLLVLRTLDVALFEHAEQHIVAPRDGVIGMNDRTVVA